MRKDTKIISDLRSFFAKNDDNRAIKCIMGIMEHINIRSSHIGVEKKENCKFTTLQVLSLLMLFPFFVVKNASRYSNSSLSKLFDCEKDMADELRETEEQIAKLEHEKTETARQMKADGMSSDLIVKYTGLTAEEIEAL